MKRLSCLCLVVSLGLATYGLPAAAATSIAVSVPSSHIVNKGSTLKGVDKLGPVSQQETLYLQDTADL